MIVPQRNTYLLSQDHPQKFVLLSASMSLAWYHKRRHHCHHKSLDLHSYHPDLRFDILKCTLFWNQTLIHFHVKDLSVLRFETAECRSKIADFKKQIGKYLDICEYNTWRTILIMHIKGFYSDTVIPSILRPQHRNSLRFPAHVDVATAIGTFPASPSYWDDAFSVPATRQTMNILQRSNLGLRQCPFKLIETSRISEAIHGPTQPGKLGYNA